MDQQNNSAKFAFFYMLSLVALLFMSLSAGMIIFQIINKNIFDVLNPYQGRYSPEALKFAISALIISVPIFYITTKQIYKNLFIGALNKDSGIRKWLTYFIIFVTSVVMTGWLIVVVNNFLDGELTTKIILKAITAIFISASIFTFYLYDIKREEVVGKKDKVIKLYFYCSLVLVIAVFSSSLLIVETPTETRNRKIDDAILNNFSEIKEALDTFYNEDSKLPESLDELKEEYNYLTDEDLEDLVTKERYEYKIIDDKTFELCATFRSSNKNNEETRNDYYKEEWPHDSGFQCIKQKVSELGRDPVRFERFD